MNRPIVLPELPEYLLMDLSHMTWTDMAEQVTDYARAAVEADRARITVTDEDVQEAIEAYMVAVGTKEYIRAALESYAARLRGGA